MSSTTALKLGFAIVLLLAALAAGVYLSGLIIVLVLGVDVPVEMNTWWKYWRIVDTPRVAPFASKIKISSAIGFGLPLLGWLALLVPLLRTRQPSTHGNARFAHKSELAKGGMLKPAGNGIVVGKAGNDLIRPGGTRHQPVPGRNRCRPRRTRLSS